jgi:hypothetical protein
MSWKVSWNFMKFFYEIYSFQYFFMKNNSVNFMEFHEILWNFINLSFHENRFWQGPIQPTHPNDQDTHCVFLDTFCVFLANEIARKANDQFPWPQHTQWHQLHPWASRDRRAKQHFRFRGRLITRMCRNKAQWWRSRKNRASRLPLSILKRRIFFISFFFFSSIRIGYRGSRWDETLWMVWLLVYAHRRRSILGATGHIILTPANQLMEE